MGLTTGVPGFIVQSAAGGGGVALDRSVPIDSENIIGSVVTNSARQNVYDSGQWNASGPYSNYFHNWQDAPSKISGWNMFMGDGVPNGTDHNMYANDGEDSMVRKKEYAHGDRIGNLRKDYEYPDNDTSYPGVTWRAVPVRNSSDLTITRTMYTYLSSTDSTYSGSSIMYYKPDTAKYSSVVSGNWFSAFSGGSDTISVSRSGSISIPAHTTVIVMVNSSHWQNTTQRFKDSNLIVNLDEFFTGGLVCDLRMLEALATVRSGQAAYNQGSDPATIYPLCATYFGDR